MIKFARFILVKATLLTICLAFVLVISVIASPHTYAASTAYNTPSVAQDACSDIRAEVKNSNLTFWQLVELRQSYIWSGCGTPPF